MMNTYEEKLTNGGEKKGDNLKINSSEGVNPISGRKKKRFGRNNTNSRSYQGSTAQFLKYFSATAKHISYIRNDYMLNAAMMNFYQNHLLNHYYYYDLHYIHYYHHYWYHYYGDYYYYWYHYYSDYYMLNAAMNFYQNYFLNHYYYYDLHYIHYYHQFWYHYYSDYSYSNIGNGNYNALQSSSGDRDELCEIIVIPRDEIASNNNNSKKMNISDEQDTCTDDSYENQKTHAVVEDVVKYAETNSDTYTDAGKSDVVDTLPLGDERSIGTINDENDLIEIVVIPRYDKTVTNISVNDRTSNNKVSSNNNNSNNSSSNSNSSNNNDDDNNNNNEHIYTSDLENLRGQQHQYDTKERDVEACRGQCYSSIYQYVKGIFTSRFW